MFSCPRKLTKKEKVLLISSLFVFTFSLLAYNTPKAQAKDECKDISDKEDQLECYAKKEEETRNKLESTKSKIDETLNTITQLSSQLSVTQSQLNGVQNNIDETQKLLEEINESLKDRNEKLFDKINFRNKLLRNYSKKNILSELELFFTENKSGLSGFQLSSFIYAFNKATSEETLAIIGNLNSEIRQFEENKKESEELKLELEKAQANLIAIKNNLAIKKVTEEEEKEELEEKEEGYEKELAELQSKILSLKAGDGRATVGDSGFTTIKTPNPPSSLGKPVFAVFSYGAATHRNGMSQYGALGRVKEDKNNYKEILGFYYPNLKLDEDYDEPDKIKVVGNGLDCNGSNKYYNETVDFDTYMKRIYEVPSSWPSDVLKAQAISARSYAIYVYKKWGSIQPNQSHQVYKNCDKGGSWSAAVEDTENMVLTKDGKAAFTEYSSTTGGYINNVGWDVKKGENWPDDAYEKEYSPWFYVAWYWEPGKSYDSKMCDRFHPWLSEEEMADIINAYYVYTEGSSDETGHVTPIKCWGGKPYSIDKMKEVAKKYGYKVGYTSVSSIKVDRGNGYITKVTVKANGRTIELDGQIFKKVFNLRAPGRVNIQTPLFYVKMEN